MRAQPSNLIYVSGNIAAGKSTAAALLQQHIGGDLLEEDVAGNPYLQRFYDDMTQWSFAVDIHFLVERCRTVMERYDPGGPPVILDRCYLEGRIFADAALEAGNVSAPEHETFISAFKAFDALMPAPAALLIVHAPPTILAARVRRRGRPFEAAVTERYLASLQRGYDTFAATYDRSPIVEWDTALIDATDTQATTAVGETLRAFLR